MSCSFYFVLLALGLECNVISLYLCVALLMDLFVLSIACLWFVW